MKRCVFSIVFLICFFTQFVVAADIQDIKWDTLIPKLPPQEYPFAGLDEEEKGFAEWIIYLRENLPKEATPENQEYHDELKKGLPELSKKGVDVDKIIADRKFRNSAVNKELDGRQVRLAGYLLPLDLSGKAVTDFLLVPYVGACIHTPPPPPNQIVHAVSSTPTPYEIERLYEPVWVVGEMRIKSLSKELFLVDGSNNIDIGYSMAVNKIERYKP